MSFFSSFSKRSTLDAAIKQVSKARKSDPQSADQLYSNAYKGFSEVISENLIISEALYNWGFALLNQAKNQTKIQAIETLEDAISKFSFCLLTAPNYLAAAIDGGVAFMELARLSGRESQGYLYKMARQFFETGCDIQKGSASYNLACLHAINGDDGACLEALKQAQQHGCLPDETVILQDVDMMTVNDKVWFKEFLEEARKMPEPEKEVDVAIDYSPKLNLKEKFETIDYYATEEDESSDAEESQTEVVADQQEETIQEEVSVSSVQVVEEPVTKVPEKVTADNAEAGKQENNA
jgi:Plant specific mitochondrial import receptor subunit TOM20